MEASVDGTFGVLDIPANTDSEPSASKVEGAACAIETYSTVDWDFTKGAIHGENGAIIDEIADFQDDLNSNSDFSSEGTVLLLDDDCPFSSAETPDALSGEENYVHDSLESDPMMYGVPVQSTLSVLSRFPLRIKQDHFDTDPSDNAALDQLPATVHIPLKPAQTTGSGTKSGGNRSRSSLNGKSHLMCSYNNCPLPYQSNKWRTVTAETGAGGQDWTPLMGKLLCDSCYSTYRKHGTLVRSVRTSEGWSRIDVDGTCRPNASAHQSAKKRQRPENCAGSEAAKARRVAAETARASALQTQAVVVAAALESSAGRPCREKRPSIRLREIMEETAAASPLLVASPL